MPKITPYESGKLASPLVDVAGRNPRGEALRGFAQDVDQTKQELETLRGAEEQGVAQLGGTALRGVGQLAGAALEVASRRAYNQNIRQRNQAATIANSNRTGDILDAESNWQARFNAMKADPDYQANPAKLGADMAALINDGVVTRPDGTTFQSIGTSVKGIQQRLQDDIDNPYDAATNAGGNPKAQETAAQLGPQIQFKADKFLQGQVHDWVQNQGAQNALSQAGENTDTAAVTVVDTAGGLQESVKAAAQQIKLVSDKISADVGALGVNGADKAIKTLQGKVNYAAVLAPLTNYPADDPTAAYKMHKEGLDALTSESYSPREGVRIPLPLNLDPTQKEHATKMYQAAISQDVTNIVRSEKQVSLTAVGGIVGRTLDANANRSDAVAQQALIIDAKKNGVILQGLAEKTAADKALPDEAKDAKLSGYNAQAEKWLEASKAANSNLQFIESEGHKAQVVQKQAATEQHKAAHEAALKDLYQRRLHFLQVASTNTGANAQEVTAAAHDILQQEQKYLMDGVILPSDADQKALLDTAAATTKHVMKPPISLLGAINIGSPRLVKQKEAAMAQSEANMKQQILAGISAVQGRITASNQDAALASSHKFNGVQQAAYDSFAAKLRDQAKANPQMWPPEAVQRRLSDKANRILQQLPAAPAIHKNAPPEDKLVPPPPAEMIMSREQWEAQGKQNGWTK